MFKFTHIVLIFTFLCFGSHSTTAEEIAPSSVALEDDESGLKRKSFSIGIKLNPWAAQFKSEVTIPRGNILGTDVDFQSDLDIDETIAISSGEFFITSRFFSLVVDYFEFEQDSSATLSANLTFAGVTFNAMAPVKTDLELDSIAAKVIVTPLSNEEFDLGIIVGARYIKVFGEISASFPIQITASDTFEVPIPFVGLQGRIFLGIVEIYGCLQGLVLEYEPEGEDRIEASYFEFELGAALNIGDNLAVFVGYRGVSIRVDQIENDSLAASNKRENKLRVLLAGPTIGLRLRF
jgi:hypothetical protein